MPKISVIVPVYKVEDYLPRCIDSILSQTFCDFELILIDDGSPDNCPKICDEYAKKDERIRVIHKENGGLSDARNAGIEWAFANSDSEWLNFIDSDDWIHPDYLKRLYDACREQDTAIGCCSYATISDGETPPPITKEYGFYSVMPEAFPERTIPYRIIPWIAAWAKLYRKELFRDVRYPVGRVHEDTFTTYKLLFKTDRIACTDAPLYRYYQRSGSITHTLTDKSKQDLLDALREQAVFFYENGYLTAFPIIVDQYFRQSMDFIRAMYEKKPYAKEIFRSRKQQLRRELRRYVKKYSFKQNLSILYFLFPIPMFLPYYAITAALRIYHGIIPGSK